MPANLPYPFQFDPSQWKNKYDPYADSNLPWFSQLEGQSGLYGGTAPTDAMGNPIQSYTDANNTAQAGYQQKQADYQKAMDAYNAAGGGKGTSINNTGGSAGATDNSALRNYIASQNGVMQGMPSNLNQGGFGSGNTVDSNAAAAQYRNNAQQMDILGRQQTQPAAAGPTKPIAPSQPNMTQAYLSALQNPGHITTPGATVAQSATPSAQSNVMQAFLNNWQNSGAKTTGAGNYNNAGFFDALKGMV